MASTKLLSREETRTWISEHFDISPDDGRMTWKVPPKNHQRMMGIEAGCDKTGYVSIKKDKRSIKRSWLIFLWVNERWPSDVLEHIDGDPLNDRISNLRETTQNELRRNFKHDVSHLKERIGERVGMLVFRGLVDGMRHANRHCGIFECDCGNTIVHPVGRILSGKHRTDCGCTTKSGPDPIHGMLRTPTYRTWQAMRRRCLIQDDKDYPRYGGKGITICDEWKSSFVSFFEYVGTRPNGTTIDRIDGTKGYEPGNVR